MSTAGSTLTGAGSGALTGAAIGSSIGPWGTAIGGLAGGLIGGIGGYFSGRSNDNAQQSMEQARQQLIALQQQQYAQRQADLERALAYFKPLEQKFGTNQGGTFAGPQPAGGAPGPRSVSGFFGGPGPTKGVR